VRRLALTLVLLAVSAHAAFAQPSLAPINPVHEPQPAVQRVKDPTTARGAAIATTAAGFGLMYLAVDRDLPPLATVGLVTTIVGPSAGHIYAGEYVHALGTTAFRGAAVGAMLGGFAMTLDLCFDVCEGQDDDDGAGAALLLGGTAALVGLTAYDLWDAHRAAARTNARHAIRVAPTALATSHGPVAGLAVGGSF